MGVLAGIFHLRSPIFSGSECCVRSCSSSSSPTICSMVSSMVTSPAMPPYSSTTIATCCRVCCMAWNRSSTGFDSGTSIGCLTMEATSRCEAAGLNAVARTASLRYATPIRSSTSSPITGTREKPDREHRRSMSASVAVRSMQIMSVRGTMISRVSVSDNVSTLRSISETSGSKSLASTRRSMVARPCSS